MKRKPNIPFVLSLVCVIGLVGCRSRRVVRTEQQYAAQHYEVQRDSVQQIAIAAQRQAHHQWQGATLEFEWQPPRDSSSAKVRIKLQQQQEAHQQAVTNTLVAQRVDQSRVEAYQVQQYQRKEQRQQGTTYQYWLWGLVIVGILIMYKRHIGK
jgi:lipoprotein